MKKIMIVIPLMAISFLASCNNVDNSKVNEQELFDALNLKDVKFMQFVMIDYNDDIQTITQTDEFSPDAYHSFGNGREHEYEEEYVFKKDSKYIKYYRYNKDSEFKMEDTDEEELATIEDFRNYAFGPIKDRKYEDFKYNEESKEYEISFELYDYSYFSSIKFSNKKVKNYTTYRDNKLNENVSFTYEQKTLVPPIALIK